MSVEQNAELLIQMASILDNQFETPIVQNLCEYMGGEIITNPPTDEAMYQVFIKDPMVQIFNNVKAEMNATFTREIVNNCYDPLGANNGLSLIVAMNGRYGWCYFSSLEHDMFGPTANSYENSPFNKNLILGLKNSDGSYTPFNTNTFPSQIQTIVNNDPNHVEGDVGYAAQTKCALYRVCRKMINSYTGITGGVLVLALIHV